VILAERLARSIERVSPGELGTGEGEGGLTTKTTKTFVVVVVVQLRARGPRALQFLSQRCPTTGTDSAVWAGRGKNPTLGFMRSWWVEEAGVGAEIRLSIQRSRVQVPSSPPFFAKLAGDTGGDSPSRARNSP